jgi:hypothetical protein
MIQRLSDIEGEPEVGKFYLVPCLLYRGDWTPVMGPRHDDKEFIGVVEEHYHRDVRFTDDGTCEYLASEIFQPAPDAYTMLSIVSTRFAKGEPVYKRRKCRRRMPEFPIELRRRLDPLITSHATWIKPLEAAYKDANANCGRCPHRGFSLQGLPVKDGKVTCPGHGLRWSVETGELVPR